jgi:SRSO17 transposase
MDAGQIRALEPLLREYVGRFADCFPRRDTRGHFPRYVRGQLSDLERKSVEPMALKMDVPVRTLQEFLSQHKWDQELMRDRLQHIVRDEHGGPAHGRESSSWKRRMKKFGPFRGGGSFFCPSPVYLLTFTLFSKTSLPLRLSS